MRHHRRSQRSSRYLLAAIALLLLGSVPAGPAFAHAFTRNDANDSASKIDLRSVSVSHTSTSVVHSVRTWNSWTPASLQHDSFFLIGINKDNDAAYERCAFIYYTNRLRGQLSNCGSQFIRYLTVSKVNATTAKITIPKTQVGAVYHWYGGSFWVGAIPCRNVCRDFAPNNLPDILHDLKPPTIEMDTTPLRTWESSTSSDFVFPFSVFDDDSGIESWRVERHAYEETAWEVVSSGGGAGDKAPTITGEPGHSFYRVVAVDKHGNVKVGPSRKVFVPDDDRDLAPAGTFNDLTPMLVPDGDAFEGTLTFLGVGDSLQYDYTQTGGPCRPFELIGPGGGDWSVEVQVNGLPFATIDGTATPPGDRQILFTTNICDSTAFLFTVTDANVEFAVDGIVSKSID